MPGLANGAVRQGSRVGEGGREGGGRKLLRHVMKVQNVRDHYFDKKELSVDQQRYCYHDLDMYYRLMRHAQLSKDEGASTLTCHQGAGVADVRQTYPAQ